MLTATIIRSPKLEKIPEWVSEACVGMKLNISHGGEGKCDAHVTMSRFRFSILPDDLIVILKEKGVHPKAAEAADWIDNNIHWGGGISFPSECIDQEIAPTRHFLLEIGKKEGQTWDEVFDAIAEALGEDFFEYSSIGFEHHTYRSDLTFHLGEEHVTNGVSEGKKISLSGIDVVEPCVAGGWFTYRRKRAAAQSAAA